MITVRYQFDVNYKEYSSQVQRPVRHYTLSFWRDANAPCLPPVGTNIIFPDEAVGEGEWSVEKLELNHCSDTTPIVEKPWQHLKYTIYLDSVDLSNEYVGGIQYNSVEDVVKYWVSQGWNH